MTVGIGEGTPMAPCIILAWGRFGNRLPISTNTWLSHPPPRPVLPFARPSYLVPFFFVPPPSPSPALFSMSADADRLTRRQRKEEPVLSGERGTKLRVCNHTVLFPIKMQLIVDTSRGENCWLCAAGLLRAAQQQQQQHKKQPSSDPKVQANSRSVKMWAAGTQFWAKRHSQRIRFRLVERWEENNRCYV